MLLHTQPDKARNAVCDNEGEEMMREQDVDLLFPGGLTPLYATLHIDSVIAKTKAHLVSPTHTESGAIFVL